MKYFIGAFAAIVLIVGGWYGLNYVQSSDNPTAGARAPVVAADRDQIIADSTAAATQVAKVEATKIVEEKTAGFATTQQVDEKIKEEVGAQVANFATKTDFEAFKVKAEGTFNALKATDKATNEQMTKAQADIIALRVDQATLNAKHLEMDARVQAIKAANATVPEPAVTATDPGDTDVPPETETAAVDPAGEVKVSQVGGEEISLADLRAACGDKLDELKKEKQYRDLGSTVEEIVASLDMEARAGIRDYCIENLRKRSPVVQAAVYKKSSASGGDCAYVEVLVRKSTRVRLSTYGKKHIYVHVAAGVSQVCIPRGWFKNSRVEVCLPDVHGRPSRFIENEWIQDAREKLASGQNVLNPGRPMFSN